MSKRKSRLQRTEEASAVRSAMFYILLTIGVIAILFFIGIPIVSRLSTIVLEFTGGVNVAGENENLPPPPPPEIDSPPQYFKNDKYSLKGSTRPGYNVNVFFNGDKIEVLSDADGEFNLNLELSSGTNTLALSVIDKNGKESVKTREYTIILDKEAPKLEIISPSEGQQFSGIRANQARIEGQTEPDAKILINERIAIVKSDGKFDFPVTLSEGENTFTIKSIDPAGNETETSLKLLYTR